MHWHLSISEFVKKYNRAYLYEKGLTYIVYPNTG